MIRHAADRLRRVEQRWVGGQQDDLAAPPTRGQRRGFPVRAAKRLVAVQRDPQQAGGDAGDLLVVRGRSRGQGGQDRAGQFADGGDPVEVGQGLHGDPGQCVQ